MRVRSTAQAAAGAVLPVMRRWGTVAAVHSAARALSVAVLGEPDLVEEEADDPYQPDAHKHRGRSTAGGTGDERPTGHADERHGDAGPVANDTGLSAHPLTASWVGIGVIGAQGPQVALGIADRILARAVVGVLELANDASAASRAAAWWRSGSSTVT